MQSFRSEPTLRSYYNDTYEFKTENLDGSIETEIDEELIQIIENGKERMGNQLWRPPQDVTGSVDWSPNRVRLRNKKKKEQERKRVTTEVPIWNISPNAS